MDQVKVFISHSSDDKEYVDSLINIVGKNGVVVDKYCFESGERTLEEIVKGIDGSGIFALLMSRSSLAKDWVKKEIKLIKQHIDNGSLKKFKPYIIDDSIDYSYGDIPEWIKDEYNLRAIYSKPPFLVRKIEEELDKLRWEQYPEIEQKEKTFVGRDSDIGKLRQKYLQNDLKLRKAVVVSGIPDGIGRRRLITEFIRKIDTNKEETYKPFSIALDRENSIEDFLLRLNNLFLFVDNEEMTAFAATAGKELKFKKTIEFLSFMAEKREKLFIRDNGACVLNDGSLSSWFGQLVKSADLDHTLLFVASRNRFTHRYDFPEVVSLELEPLTLDNAKTLLRQYLDNQGKSITEENAEYFIGQTGRMPIFISKCADLIADMGPVLAKQHHKAYQYAGDDLTRTLIADYQQKRTYLQVLILLSEFDFLTYSNIRQATRGIIDDIDDILSEFYSSSIYETFGSNNEYFRMNPVLADVVNRSRLRYDEELWGQLRERTHNIVEEETFEEANLGVLLKKIEAEIKGNTNNISKSHIIPSIALKAINDEYRKKTKEGYRNVVALCLRLLENNKNYYIELIDRIYYLLCAAYAQLGDKAFFDYRKELRQYDYYFLTGLYNRKLKRFDDAEFQYRKALEIKPNSLTAKNELAIALQRQNNYKDALELAEFSCGEQPTNPFYIVTYFKSLVRVRPSETESLQKLINDLRAAWDSNKETFGEMLQAEYAYFIEKKFDKAVRIYNAALEKNPLYPVFKSFHEICTLERKVPIATGVAKQYGFDTEDLDYTDF